ncbi:hypothetical protein CPHO_05525 [Corynebacterium phocae]|uniref:ABC transporter domain-containing protein n=1 Tax=Corynebacterium phocae TaxID=161895 RepID=A0A1L7D353_9CORY|nr:hypothetical protein [Corynebacterium phocae]APT92431.1 hypothetical protein CPHO_05525 [Corynebacterium phocae]KAA8725032.1 hypothetical protein F4V58_05060 [Corynebacterium phocae]
MNLHAHKEPAPAAPPAQVVLTTRDLVLATGFQIPDFRVITGLNLIHASRETSATVLALTLAGRMKPNSGGVALDERLVTHRELFRDVALAGAAEIDRLERLVPAWTVVREQVAWSRPWYQPTPRNMDCVEDVARAFDAVGLELDDAALRATKVGDLDVSARLKLRTALALIARPDPTLIIVDDIDQLRSNHLRHKFLDALKHLSSQVPVLAISANDAEENNHVDNVIRIAGEK